MYTVSFQINYTQENSAEVKKFFCFHLAGEAERAARKRKASRDIQSENVREEREDDLSSVPCESSIRCPTLRRQTVHLILLPVPSSVITQCSGAVETSHVNTETVNLTSQRTNTQTL